MIPNSMLRREKPERSVNMIAQSSPNKSQMRLSMAAVSAPGLTRCSIKFHSRDWLAFRPSSDELMRPSISENFGARTDRCESARSKEPEFRFKYLASGAANAAGQASDGP